MSELNHVMLHQLLQVIKKPPAIEVVTFNFSTLKCAAAYNLFPRYSNMFMFICACWLKCIETSLEMRWWGKSNITLIHPKGVGGCNYRSDLGCIVSGALHVYHCCVWKALGIHWFSGQACGGKTESIESQIFVLLWNCKRWSRKGEKI